MIVKHTICYSKYSFLVFNQFNYYNTIIKKNWQFLILLKGLGIKQSVRNLVNGAKF